MTPAPVPPDGEPDTAGIEAAKQAVYESMPVVLKDLVSRSEAEAAIGVPHGAGVPDRWLADVAVRAYLAAGRAAATPDPPDMTNMCEGESPDHKPGITPAASPDPPESRVLADIDMGDDDYEAEARLGIDGAYTCSGCDTIHVPAASPDERLREALTRIERLVARWDAPIRHDVDDRVAYEKWAAVGSEAHKIAADALAAADREAPDEGGGAMSEFRVVDANGDPYPPHAQPCRTLAAAALRRDFYQQVTSVSGEARMPVRPLRIERRSAVVSMWEPWNVGAASGLRKGASDE